MLSRYPVIRCHCVGGGLAGKLNAGSLDRCGGHRYVHRHDFEPIPWWQGDFESGIEVYLKKNIKVFQ